MDAQKKSVDSRPTRRISRRRFLKLAAAAGILTGCRAGPIPTSVPTQAPSATSEPTATVAPTEMPEPSSSPRRPEIIQFYPDVPSKVIHARHAGVWAGEELAADALRQMVDAAISRLTGLEDPGEAWAALFAPDERVAIKVNAFRNSTIWTHVPLVMAVTDALQEAGLPSENITIFDYYTTELEEAGFPVNRDGPGVRCYGTDQDCSGMFDVNGRSTNLSQILLESDALVNMPVLKSHMMAGITFAMKNHYGTVSYPNMLHTEIGPTIAALNELEPIKERTRLIVGDMLEACLAYGHAYPYWEPDWTGDSILMSFDPVAHDTFGLEVLSQLKEEAGQNSASVVGMATPGLERAAELALGTNDPEQMDVIEVNL